MLLEEFILLAKQSTYMGDGDKQPSSRNGSHDLGYHLGSWSYLDSYYGGTNFAGQEAVWFDQQPRWVMHYFGRVLEPSLIDGTRAGRVIKAALSDMYRNKGSFLGGTTFQHADGNYVDESTGTVEAFTGRETISVNGTIAYELHYHGGCVFD
jgi:Domain of unknown function (DUF5680)